MHSFHRGENCAGLETGLGLGLGIAEGITINCAKVQIGAELLCKSAKVSYKTQRGQQRETGWLARGYISGLGSQVTGYLVRVFWFGYGCGS